MFGDLHMNNMHFYTILIFLCTCLLSVHCNSWWMWGKKGTDNSRPRRVPARILEYASSKDRSVREGQDVTLWCNATGIPEPNITWFRIHQTIPQSRIRVGDVGDTLIIKNISRHCGGEYECMADNGVKAAVQHTIKVDVHFPPEVSLMNYRQSQRVGRETILQCNVSASPLGVNVWKFGDREFDRQSARNFQTEMYREDKMRYMYNT